VTTRNARWATDGFDIHVMAGMKLDRYLLLDQSGGSSVPANPLPASVTDVKAVLYTPTFTGTVSGDTITQSGVRMNRKTGVVEIIGTLGKLRNFIVEVTVTLKDGTTTFNPGPLRIHLHHSLRVSWLTPSKLTIPLDEPPPPKLRGYRLSVLALFAEDPNDNFQVVGDITRQSGLLFDSNDKAQTITWSPKNVFVVDVDTNSGELKGGQAGTTDITAHFSPAYTGIGLDAVSVPVTCRGAWPSVEIKPVGKGSTSFATHHVLILPEGFASTERAQFEKMAAQLVTYLRSEVVTPLHVLPLNYWTAWVDIPGSTDRGISVLPAIKVTDHDAPDGGNGIDAPTKPRSKPGGMPARIWDLRELVYQVGLPIPSDGPRSASLLTFPEKLPEWQALVGAAALDDTVVDGDLYFQWINLAEYRLADERDSVFSVARGERPRGRESQKLRTLGFHPLRMTRKHLDRFLSKLTYNGVVVGSRWTDGNPDYPFVVFLCAGSPRGGTTWHGAGTIFSSLSDNRYINFDVPPGGVGMRVQLSPKALPKTPSLDLRTTVAHELGHALGLGDEYGEGPVIPPERGGEIVAYPNLHLASDLLVAGKINADAIRWRWPRIRKAALLADPPTPGVNTVTIKLQPGFDARFKENAFGPGDLVRLRERPLEKIVKVGGHDQWRPVKPSAFRLRISGKPSAGVDSANQPAVVITAEPDPPGSPMPAPATLAAYGKDSLLIAPIPDPDNPDRDLFLMATFVEDRIAAADVPLNRRKGKACAPEDGQQFPLRLDDSPRIRIKQPRIMQRVVGVYDGGKQFHCGVYHPTGACMMRDQFFSELTIIINLGPGPATGGVQTRDRTYPFCHICRYILADKYDPTLHAVIEKDFRKNFAVKK